MTTTSDKRYNWILSSAKDDKSSVHRLVCAETGVEYILTVVDGEIRSLQIDDKEIIQNAEVAKQLWAQLAMIVSFAPSVGFNNSLRMNQALQVESDG